MANREACEVYIEEEVRQGLAEGKTAYAIGKEVSGWIAKHLEVNIPADTIRVRADRAKKKLCTNVHSDLTTEILTEKEKAYRKLVANLETTKRLVKKTSISASDKSFIRDRMLGIINMLRKYEEIDYEFKEESTDKP